MKTKPLLIKLITLGLVLVPTIFLLRLSFLNESKLMQSFPIHVFSTNIIAIISLIVAYGIWNVRLWGFYSLLSFGLVTFILDIYAFIELRAPFNFWMILDLGAAAAGAFLILKESTRKPYFDPKIRWWETPTRLKVDLPAQVIFDGQTLSVLVLDISKTGLFVDCELPFGLEKLVEIEINYKNQFIKSSAILVRKSQIPKGTGLKFTPTSQLDQKTLKQLKNSLLSKDQVEFSGI